MLTSRLAKSIHVKAIFLLFAFNASAVAEYNPPAGAEDYYAYISPDFFAGAVSATGVKLPSSALVNPATSGFSQIPAYEINYTTLFDTAGLQGWGGHMVNIAGSNPTRIGVIGWGARFFSSQMDNFTVGMIGEGAFTISKAVGNNTLVGAGISGGINSNDTFDWALSGDFGFLHYVATERFSNVRWGISFMDFGKSFKAREGNTAYPPPYTPLVSYGLTAIDTKNFDLHLDGTISFPSFQNVRAGIGLEMQLFDKIGVELSSTYDMRRILAQGDFKQSYIPNFGVSICLSPSADLIKLPGGEPAELRLQSAAGRLTKNIWGIGLGASSAIGEVDDVPPEIEINCADGTILSFNGEGREKIEIDAQIQDDRYIFGCSLEVEDMNGTKIRTDETKFEKPEGNNFKEVIKNLGYIYRSVHVPESFAWEGKDDGGNYVTDGSYVIYLKAWDDNGNTAVSKKCKVEVDSTAPVAVVEPLNEVERIFSPNNDGNKDTILIEQTGSEEDRWIGIIAKGDEIVRTYTWENGKPESFEWDGVGDDGTLAKDGVYTYSISATDRAGNSKKTVLEELILNSQVTPISVTIDRAFISPNGDGVFDELLLQAKVPVTSGIREWSISIRNQSGTVVKKYSGTGAVPETTMLDGYDESGKQIPEGRYTAYVEVTYVNGNNPTSVSPQFTIDVTPPEANVTSDYVVFSPDGDGSKDTITFFQEASVEQEWKGEIYTADGLGIKQYIWRDRPERSVSWDGHGIGGLIAPNGTYSYKIFAVDRAGNRGESEELFFDLNTEAASVYLTRQHDAISPNADGVQDLQRFTPQVSIGQGIDTYSLSIYDENGSLVRTFNGRNGLEESYTWGGLRDDGGRVRDGNYYATMEIRYKNGNTPSATTRPFQVDTVFPLIRTAASVNLFSPNGDGKKDTVTFTNSSGREELWEARIIDKNGAIVRRVFWKDYASTFVWDGTDDAGNLVADGEYSFEVFTTDIAGNYSIARTAGVRLDTRPTAIFITTGSESFSPNGDGVLEDITFTTLVTEKYGAVSWKLDIKKANGNIVKEFEGTRIPEKVVWNGKGDNGGTIEDGEYIATFEVVYDMGNVPQARSAPFYIDTGKPEIELRFSPRLISPDGDGVGDMVEFTADIRDLTGIEKWSLTIIDPRGKLFREYQGNGTPPKKLYWNGTSTTGETVLSGESYPFEFYVEDAVGNSSAVLDEIAVDILVNRERESYRIVITNFSFVPNSAALESDKEILNTKNNWILQRIAEFCRKQSNYYIEISGHAVSIYWNDAERAKLEQERQLVPLTKARAETIANALTDLGIDRDRIVTKGVGGAEPIVPHGDLENRWKNKRIEFILHK